MRCLEKLPYSRTDLRRTPRFRLAKHSQKNYKFACNNSNRNSLHNGPETKCELPRFGVSNSLDVGIAEVVFMDHNRTSPFWDIFKSCNRNVGFPVSLRSDL